MNSNGPAQASETPFNISDYVNFEFDLETPNQSVDVSSETSVVEPLRGMSIDDPYAGFVDAADTQSAGIFQLPDGSNALGDDFAASLVPSEDCDIPNTFEAPISAAALLGDFTPMNPVFEDLGMTDAFQTATETDSPLDDFTVSRATALTHGINPAALEISRCPSRSVPPPKQVSTNPEWRVSPQAIREPSRWAPLTPGVQRGPSRWVLACPQLQRHLNSVYAAELTSIRTNPSPAPVVYFPAGQRLGSHVPVDSFPPRSVPRQYEISQTSQRRTENPSVAPSSLMQAPQQPSSDRMYHPTSPLTDGEVPNAEDLALSPTKKRAIDTDESDTEPAPKRAKIGQTETMPKVAKDNDSDDDDEPVMKRTRSARRNSLPTVAKHDESEDDSDDESNDESEDESDDDPEDKSDVRASSARSSASPSRTLPPTPVTRKATSALPPSSPVPKKRPNRRSEQQHKSRPRNQQRKGSSRSRENYTSAKGKAANRELQKLLEEIEDTEEFAEAQGYEVESKGSQDAVPRRPVRRGARKSYVGQE